MKFNEENESRKKGFQISATTKTKFSMKKIVHVDWGEELKNVEPDQNEKQITSLTPLHHLSTTSIEFANLSGPHQRANHFQTMDILSV
jgi:hypothetical protein